MRFLKDSNSPPPRALAAAAEIVVNSELGREFTKDPLDFETIQILLEEADLAAIPLDADTFVLLAATGRFKAHVIAFARTHKERCSITVVPRLLTGLVSEKQYPLGRRVWQDTAIVFPEKNASCWKNVFTGEILETAASLNVGRMLNHFPCALFEDTPCIADPAAS